MAITRRDLLKNATAAAAVTVIPFGTGCDDDGSGPQYFLQGVASGDPLTDRVILWTRVSPPTEGPIEVSYQIALDEKFKTGLIEGTTTTDASKDYTVKVDPSGLTAGTTYYYRFRSIGSTSPVGRTKTLPTGTLDHLRFAMVSCANYAFGYFHVYRHVSERPDLDAVLFLGDYIYEYGDGGDYPSPGNQLRPWTPPHEILTLDDYRQRHRLYKSDADLQEAHRQHAWICTWDDHEIANDTYDTGAGNHMPDTEGPFAARKAAAIQAYYEYMPIRGVGGVDPMYRNFRIGDLAEIIVLDTRDEGRVKQIDDISQDTPDRTMISATQEQWLADTLDATDARWKIIAQQVMVGLYSLDAVDHVPFYLDQWDDYPSARQRLYDIFEDHGGGNIVVLTGDIHSSHANELPRDSTSAAYDPVTGAGSLAVEFVCPAVTSPALGGEFFEQPTLDGSPGMKYCNLQKRGYTILDVRPGKVQADWYHIEDVTLEGGAQSWVKGMAVMDGTAHLVDMPSEETP